MHGEIYARYTGDIREIYGSTPLDEPADPSPQLADAISRELVTVTVRVRVRVRDRVRVRVRVRARVRVRLNPKPTPRPRPHLPEGESAGRPPSPSWPMPAALSRSPSRWLSRRCTPGAARCREIWGDVGRCGEMWGDVGRYREM